MNKKFYLILLVLVLSLSTIFANGTKEVKDDKKMSVLVYVTGVTEGSPSYELLVEGAQQFASDYEDVKIKVYEAGFNQAEWKSQLLELVASGDYNLVITSNPSLPEICAEVGKDFPSMKFIVTDAFLDGNNQIRTYLFNQYEQSFILGYLAGLVTESDMEYANNAKKIGFIASQEFPVLNKHMVPGFIDGAHLVDSDIQLDFRIIGNWYDANKCAELASNMIDSGVDVFVSIAGGAEQGLLKTAEEKGAYVVHYDTDIYASPKGYVIGCGVLGQKELVYKALTDAYNNSIQYGKATIEGLQEGYINFNDKNPIYSEVLSQNVKTKFDSFLNDFRTGKIDYSIPSLNP